MEGCKCRSFAPLRRFFVAALLRMTKLRMRARNENARRFSVPAGMVFLVYKQVWQKSM
jgi:hypothetical protein